MALFNVAEYGVDVYGQAPRLEYSVYPFRAFALDYSSVSVKWTQPEGDFSAIRLVQSFDGYPETAEDGAIVWEWDSASSEPKITELVDSNNVPSGVFVYYRIWILKLTGEWTLAGDAMALVPSKHEQLAPEGGVLSNTHQQFMDIIPRVFTSASQSPVDVVDEESDLYRFLEGFSFTLDVIMTYADLILPKDSNRYSSPELLLLQVVQLGLIPEPFLATKQQRRLAREAMYIYQNKGSLIGLAGFIEALTGFAPDVTMSPNLVLSSQDSSFTEGYGFWRPAGDCTLEIETTVPGVTPEVEPYIADYRYTGKVVVETAGARLTSGNDFPITRGTPIEAGVPYTFSGYGKAESTDMEVTAHAIWYDYQGNPIRIDPPRIFPQDNQTIPSSDWTRYEFVGRAPGVEKAITSVAIDTGVVTLTLDSYNAMLPGETIKVSGISTGVPLTDSALNTYHQVIAVGAVGEPWLQIAAVAADLEDTAVIGTMQEAYPTLSGPSGNSDAYYTEIFNPASTAATAAAAWTGVYYGVGAVAISSGVASVTMDSVTGLNVGDLVLFLGIDATLSFGHHVITDVDTLTNTIQFVTTHADAVFGPGTLGFVMKVVPNSGFVVDKATYVGFELVFQTAGTIYLDLLQMATYDVQEYHEARAAEIFLHPTKSNYVKNPEFEAATFASTWTTFAVSTTSLDRTVPPLSLVGEGGALEVETIPSAAATATMASYEVADGVATITMSADPTAVFFPGMLISISGNPSTTEILGVHTIATVTSTEITFAVVMEDTISPVTYPAAVTPLTSISTTTDAIDTGKFVASSIYLKTADIDGMESLNLSATAYDISSGTPVQVASVNKDILVTGAWERYNVTMFVPTIAAKAYSTVGVVLTLAGATTGDTIYLDRPQIEHAFNPTDYFDGSAPTSYGAVWEGEENNSTSHMYPNLAVKVTRLKQELPKYLPLNTSFLIRWYGGGIAKPYLK